MKFILSTKEDLNEANLLSVKLKTELSTISIENFSGNEKFISLASNIENSDILFIFKSLWPNPNDKILELLLILDFIKYNRGSKSEVELFIPFLPYLRQDRELKKHSAIGSRMIADILNSYNISKIYSIDVHSKASINFFSNKLYNIDSTKYFANKLRNYISDFSKTIIIAPDEGSRERASNLCKQLNNPDNLKNPQDILINGFKGETSGAYIQVGEHYESRENHMNHLKIGQDTIPSSRLNQTNGFKGETSGAYTQVGEHGESRENHLDHLKMELGIEYSFIKKTRTPNSIISEIFLEEFYQNIVIVDDMLDSGKTIISAIEALKNKTENIFLCISHILHDDSKEKIIEKFPNVKFITIDNYADLFDLVD